MAYFGVNLPGPFHVGTSASISKPIVGLVKDLGGIYRDHFKGITASLVLVFLVATGAIVPIAVGLFAAYWIIWRPVVAIQRRRGVDAWTFMDAWRAWRAS